MRRIRPPLGHLRRVLRSWVDRRLHRRRRAKALRDLHRARGAVRRILFACQGNVCRSPYAEYRLRRRLRRRSLELEVSSAGFLPGGRPAATDALSVALARSVDLSDHRSRTLSADLVEAADLVVVMEPGQSARLPGGRRAHSRILVLGDLDPEPVERRSIRDPWGEDRATFEAVFERIDRCTDVLLECLEPGAEGRRSSPSAGPRGRVGARPGP